MSKLYIANTSFELELQEPGELSLQEILEKHPICLQLQFLPLLFAGEKDAVLVTAKPSEEYLEGLKMRGFKIPHLFLHSEKIPSNLKIVSWGYSKSVASFAEQKGLDYERPSWEVVKRVNSKAFSFENSPKLPHGQLISSLKELEAFLEKLNRKAVLKTCFGLSGRGHYFALPGSRPSKALKFCQKEWEKNLPVIAEPWVERILDFSSQWILPKEEQPKFLGVTKMVNSPLGQYEGSIIGQNLFAGEQHWIDEHMEAARKILLTMQQEGYFGFVGIDAMVYQEKGKSYLQPIVEINARMTMALAMLLMQQNRYAQETLFCSYNKGHDGLLPEVLMKESDSVMRFNRQLIVSVI